MNLHASYVSVADFDDLVFQVSFDTEDPDADFDLQAPEGPYLLIQREFEDEDGGVCYIETHEPDFMPGTSGCSWSSSPQNGFYLRSTGRQIARSKSRSPSIRIASARSSGSCA